MDVAEPVRQNLPKLYLLLRGAVIHLDHLFWLESWRQRNEDDFDALLIKELKKEVWIIEGDYFRTMALRAGYADMVIRLDYNRFVCLYRAVKRFFQRQEQSEGCIAKIDFPFLWYIFWQYPNKQRQKQNVLKADLLSKNACLKWLDLKSPKQANAYLKALEFKKED